MTTDTRPLPERLAQHTTHLRAKRMPTQDDRTSLQLLEELGLVHCQDGDPALRPDAMIVPVSLIAQATRALEAFASTKHALASVQKHPEAKSLMMDEQRRIEDLGRQLRTALKGGAQ